VRQVRGAGGEDQVGAVVWRHPAAPVGPVRPEGPVRAVPDERARRQAVLESIDDRTVEGVPERLGWRPRRRKPAQRAFLPPLGKHDVFPREGRRRALRFEPTPPALNRQGTLTATGLVDQSPAVPKPGVSPWKSGAEYRGAARQLQREKVYR